MNQFPSPADSAFVALEEPTDPKTQFVEQLLMSAVRDISAAVGTEPLGGWFDEKGRRVLAHNALHFFGDSDCRVKEWSAMVDALREFLLDGLRRAKTGESFCLRIGGTGTYVTKWDPHNGDHDCEIKTADSFADRDILSFPTHFEAYLVAEEIGRLEGCHMSIESRFNPLTDK
jgi:hypothetical protein